MKKSIATIKENPEFVLSVSLIILLIGMVSYNIAVHGIVSTTAFEF
jgi:hypothetical protein